MRAHSIQGWSPTSTDIIIGADFNTRVDDVTAGKNSESTRLVNKFHSLLTNYDLIDSYRHIFKATHDHNRGYTYAPRDKTPSRLDYLLITKRLVDISTLIMDIIPSAYINSDHSALSLTVSTNSVKPTLENNIDTCKFDDLLTDAKFVNNPNKYYI